ncbi:hypothetical protein D9758_014192 [Tetrapyrgos nigripes]|uniref:ENTH domain-containing protein n=1 Tax=Tetrapyrgos nigripes TaxID=182062 RepID=A0A8H5FNY0_9AGAR|nr:hypothetical protein D9758_014192 [Tetrapyrgos nigripes]
MDTIEKLGSQLSQITMYDIKSMYEQASFCFCFWLPIFFVVWAKNVVLNVSEIEAKVREATNDDPWGASSTLMQDIANRTFNYPDFNEIMPSIYSRFMEKEARQWRQIYKALQLLEYLIKHGSERVVDDARSHVSTIKMLRNFHYIDDKGKDQGINVRNRAKEIVELLSDVDTIRVERRKAKANKNKYTGTGNDGMSFSSDGGGSRYGGFGSDHFYSGSGGGGGSSSGYGGSYSGSYSGGGGGGGYGNERSSSYSSGGGGGGSRGFRDSSEGRNFEEYDAGDDDDRSASAVSPTSTSSRNNYNARSSISGSGSAGRAPQRKPTAPLPPPEPVKEVNLLDGFDDDTFGSALATPTPSVQNTNTNKALPSLGGTQSQNVLDDDDFADFQIAPSTPSANTATAPASTTTTQAANPAAGQKMNLMEMLNSTPAAAPAQNRSQSLGMGGMPMQGQFGGMGGMGGVQMQGTGGSMGGMGGMGGMGMGMGMHRSNNSLSMGGMGGMGMGMGMGMGSQPTSPQSQRPMSTMSPMSSSMTATTTAASASKPASSKSSGGGNFDDLWSMGLGTVRSGTPSSTNTNTTGGSGAGKSMKDLEKEKASAGLWGALGSQGSGSGSGGAKQPAMGSGMGSFTSGGGSGGGDDLLL